MKRGSLKVIFSFPIFLALLFLSFNFSYANFQDQDSIIITAVGDINLGGKVGKIIAQRGVNYPWEKVRHLFSLSDINFGNLECSISNRGKPLKGKKYTFRGNPQFLKGLSQAGINFLSLANNHTQDYGRIAFLDTMESLKKEKIIYAGAGKNNKEAYSLKIIEVKKERIGFLAYSGILPPGWEATAKKPGIASAKNISSIIGSIKQARGQVNYLIVSLHWGKENSPAPLSSQRKLAKLIIDAGALIVLGHHPHVIQGFERYKRGLIVYSLGNFIFSPGSSKGRYSAILQLKLCSGELKEIKVFPIYIKDAQPQLMKDKKGNSWLVEIQKRSLKLRTNFKLFYKEIFLLHTIPSLKTSNSKISLLPL